jgi:hypothetical protein
MSVLTSALTSANAMDNTPLPPSALIAVAAAMRAAGESWEAIAKKVGRSAERVRHWPRLYADEWSRHFRAAETHLLADAGTEARQKLRLLLRSDKEWVQLAAAQQMMTARLTERARELKLAAGQSGQAQEQDRVVSAFVKEVRNMSDEELNHMCAEFVAEQAKEAGNAAPGGNASGDGSAEPDLGPRADEGGRRG